MRGWQTSIPRVEDSSLLTSHDIEDEEKQFQCECKWRPPKTDDPLFLHYCTRRWNK